jgi:hypothetical protein
MNKSAGRIAEIQYTTGPQPIVELTVPHGTQMKDLFKVQDLISSSIIRKISPRGCNACTSGVHLNIREQFENVVQVDLGTGKFL